MQPQDFHYFIDDSTNRKDKTHYHWMIVRTLPGEERKLQQLIQRRINQGNEGNILEVYNPVKSIGEETATSKGLHVPLFAGHVFVLATHQDLSAFIADQYPNGHILYARKMNPDAKAEVWTIPEAQMRFFREFNENYADRVVVLERPYTDYAFNPKTNQPNPVIKVLDGSLAGKIGYLSRFKGNRRLVFNMQNPYGPGEKAFAIPDVWNFHCVLLHNAECDRTTLETKKARAVDLLLGIIQSCGYVDESISLLHQVTDILYKKPSLVHLCQQLFRKYKPLSQALTLLNAQQAELILYLMRYEQDHPGYVKQIWRKQVIRPFLTPPIMSSVIRGG